MFKTQYSILVIGRAIKNEAGEPSCGVCWHTSGKHKLQERAAHVLASRNDNVCVRLSSPSSAHIMEENYNEHGPSQLADATNIAQVWNPRSECGKLRVVRKWHVIRCGGMLLRNRESDV